MSASGVCCCKLFTTFIELYSCNCIPCMFHCQDENLTKALLVRVERDTRVFWLELYSVSFLSMKIRFISAYCPWLKDSSFPATDSGNRKQSNLDLPRNTSVCISISFIYIYVFYDNAPATNTTVQSNASRKSATECCEMSRSFVGDGQGCQTSSNAPS